MCGRVRFFISNFAGQSSFLCREIGLLKKGKCCSLILTY